MWLLLSGEDWVCRFRASEPEPGRGEDLSLSRVDDDASIVGSGGGARDNLGVAPRKEELGLFISKHGRVDREAWMLPFKWRLKREIALHVFSEPKHRDYITSGIYAGGVSTRGGTRRGRGIRDEEIIRNWQSHRKSNMHFRLRRNAHPLARNQERRLTQHAVALCHRGRKFQPGRRWRVTGFVWQRHANQTNTPECEQFSRGLGQRRLEFTCYACGDVGLPINIQGWAERRLGAKLAFPVFGSVCDPRT